MRQTKEIRAAEVGHVEQSEPVANPSPAARSAAWVLVVLVSVPLLLPMISTMVSDPHSAARNSEILMADVPKQPRADLSVTTVVDASGYSISSGSRDVASLLVALISITLLAWRRTLRLHGCMPRAPLGRSAHNPR